jgi:CxxC-x17-CxxC domain-containing protein
MNNYNDKKQFGGGGYKGGFKGGFGGKKSFGGRGGFDGPKEMFTATCAKCGKTCEVPFRPNGVKPVYCNDCFVKDGDSAPRGDFASRAPRREFAPRPSFQNDRPAARPDQAFNDLKAELRVVNANLERLISIMSVSKEADKAPKADKPAKAEKPAKVSKKKAE